MRRGRIGIALFKQALAHTQALPEIFERHVKYRIISEALCLPEVPDDVIARFPNIRAGIAGLRRARFGILVRVASPGGRYPVVNVTLLHPKDQGVFSSYGASALRDRPRTRDD